MGETIEKKIRMGHWEKKWGNAKTKTNIKKRGLPFSASVRDITEFFSGFSIEQVCFSGKKKKKKSSHF